MTVPNGDVARACHVIDASGAADLLDDALRTDPRGRRRALPIRTFLIGALLTVQHDRQLTISAIHHTLTEELSRTWQWELGVLRRDAGTARDQRTVTLPRSQLYQLTKTMNAKLNHTPETEPDLDETERQRRHAAIEAFAEALLEATLPPARSRARAIDGSGIWAWARGKRVRKSGRDGANEGGAAFPQEANVPDEDPATADSAVQLQAALTGAPHDRDARWGVKTSKSGTDEIYFGYELHGIVRVHDRHAPPDNEPTLVERFALTPAAIDIVEPTLAMLDSALAAGHPIEEVVVDRHYSYKTPERWGNELRRRGIAQHLDLHPNEQGFRDYNGAKLAAGWLHCPGTPDRLGSIPRPAANAPDEEHDAFAEAIAERQQYGFRRVESHRASDGRARWECPAVAGTVGCPLRQGSVEVAQQLGLPIVANPPEAATAPACCTQQTVSTKADAQPKLAQPHYWGSPEWRAAYNRRSYVEGAFGNLKNASAENVRRGFFRLTGLGPVTVLMAVAIAACNIRQLRNWHERTGLGDPDHPLLAPDDDDHGFVHLTAQQAADLDAQHSSAA